MPAAFPPAGWPDQHLRRALHSIPKQRRPGFSPGSQDGGLETIHSTRPMTASPGSKPKSVITTRTRQALSLGAQSEESDKITGKIDTEQLKQTTGQGCPNALISLSAKQGKSIILPPPDESVAVMLGDNPESGGGDVRDRLQTTGSVPAERAGVSATCGSRDGTGFAPRAAAAPRRRRREARAGLLQKCHNSGFFPYPPPPPLLRGGGKAG